MPSSGMHREIARILKDEGYIEGFERGQGRHARHAGRDAQVRADRERVISGLKRVSKPGRRIYAKKDRPHQVLGGMGVAILSTSKGVVTGRQAQDEGVGGEVLCYVW